MILEDTKSQEKNWWCCDQGHSFSFPIGNDTLAIGRHRGRGGLGSFGFTLIHHCRAFNNVSRAGVSRGEITCSFREGGCLLYINNMGVCVGIIVTVWRV